MYLASYFAGFFVIKDPVRRREMGRLAAIRRRLKNPYVPKPKPPPLTPEEKAVRKKAWNKKAYEKNKEKVLATARAYRMRNLDKERDNRKAHYQRNKEHVAKVTKSYRENNKSLYAEADARRRATEIKAAVPWGDPGKIKMMYSEAARLTKETGVPHEVDHVVPLQGRNVSGLHWEGNMEVVTRAENRSKSRKWVVC